MDDEVVRYNLQVIHGELQTPSSLPHHNTNDPQPLASKYFVIEGSQFF
jgi:hypothetical protein